MKIHELVILSGKGGTGKTSVTASLAAWCGTSVLTDADVDGANLDLVLKAKRGEETAFPGRRKAVIKPSLCSACGICADLCRFEAISPSTPHARGGVIMRIDAEACEGCGLCLHRCPAQAISMQETAGGSWKHSSTPWGELFHAALAPGAENSGKLVALLRKEARERAQQIGISLLLTDGPPGSGCPVIASITGAQQVLIVTEPTPSGLSDARRVLELCRYFHRPVQLAVNKWDLSPDVTDQVVAWAKSENVDVVGRLPYDSVVSAAIRQGIPVWTMPASPWHEAFAAMAAALALPGLNAPGKQMSEGK
jgi:MinD superfamily P-loop ATPase